MPLEVLAEAVYFVLGYFDAERFACAKRLDLPAERLVLRWAAAAAGAQLRKLRLRFLLFDDVDRESTGLFLIIYLAGYNS